MAAQRMLRRHGGNPACAGHASPPLRSSKSLARDKALASLGFIVQRPRCSPCSRGRQDLEYLPTYSRALSAARSRYNTSTRARISGLSGSGTGLTQRRDIGTRDRSEVSAADDTSIVFRFYLL